MLGREWFSLAPTELTSETGMPNSILCNRRSTYIRLSMLTFESFVRRVSSLAVVASCGDAINLRLHFCNPLELHVERLLNQGDSYFQLFEAVRRRVGA
jgi:hypothetical protein